MSGNQNKKVFCSGKVSSTMAICQMCGKEIKASQVVHDEDEGIIMCPMCDAEKNSCGCSDAGAEH
ncbi:MAG: hypothetical protein KQH63_14370 [Desulfobulbaceae bacterium]|nr:hypothetical protein [Desulfobulbaceae bacterium]